MLFLSYEEDTCIKQISSRSTNHNICIRNFCWHSIKTWKPWPYCFNFQSMSILDCEQSLFFFRFSKGSARAHKRLAAKKRDTRNESSSPRRKKRDCSLLSCLFRLAPSVTRVVICVSRPFCSTDQEKRKTALSLVHPFHLLQQTIEKSFNPYNIVLRHKTGLLFLEFNRAS